MNSLEVLKIALTNYPQLFSYNWTDCKRFNYKWFKVVVDWSLFDKINNGHDVKISDGEQDFLIEMIEEIIIEEKWYTRFFNNIVITRDCSDFNASIITGINRSNMFVMQQLNSDIISFSSVIGDRFQAFDCRAYHKARYENLIKKAENSIKYYQDELNKLKEN